MRGLIDRLLARARPVVERFVAIGVVQASVVLAAQAFMALIPLLIGVVALAPKSVGDSIAQVARRRLGLAGQTEDQLQHLVATGDRVQSSLTLLGLVLVLFSATSFTRALQRVYEAAWQVPKGGLRGSVRGLAWLVGLIAYFALIALALKLTSSRAFAVSALRTALVLACSLSLWWLTPFVLLCGRVRLRALAATALLTTAATYAAGWLSTVIMPRRISSSERQFGTIGVAFAVESWLVVTAAVVVVAAMLGALVAQAGGRFGALARGTVDPDGWHREPTVLRGLARGAAQPGAARTGSETADNAEPGAAGPAQSGAETDADRPETAAGRP